MHIEAAIIALRMARRSYNNSNEYHEALKDFIRDPEVFWIIAMCFQRQYYREGDASYARVIASNVKERPPELPDHRGEWKPGATTDER